MQVSSDDLTASLGYRPGVRQVDVVFRNPDIDIAGVPAHVSPLGGLVVLRSAAAAVEVVSASAADAAAGTGAQEVTVYGLDAQYNEVSEVFSMDGVTAVVGTVLFLRVNMVLVTAAGTGKTNAGAITVRDVGGAGNNVSSIDVARGVSEVGVYTVPAGHTMLATGWTCASRDGSGSSSADIEFFTTKDGARRVDWSMVVSGTVPANLGSPHVFREKTDIEVVVSRVLANNTLVFFHGHGLLVASSGTGL